MFESSGVYAWLKIMGKKIWFSNQIRWDQGFFNVIAVYDVPSIRRDFIIRVCDDICLGLCSLLIDGQ